MKKTPLVVALGAMFMVGTAFAAEDFATADANADGQVTVEEAAAAAPEITPEIFAEADANGDGTLSADEYAAATAG
ncbi:MAG: hypothetical protein OEL78_00840 [Hyphomicrobiales bacterium]|jgi:hypothetical protein|nr:hypothetical protein [Hyphomicrobiales bacterium]